MIYLHTKDLSIGYSGEVLIDGINIRVESGKILTLIGPNGSGKSTILKTITGHLERITGVVEIDGRELGRLSERELAQRLSVMLTDRIRPELMTCRDVVSMGRYPFTNHFGRLSDADRQVVDRSLDLVAAADLADRPFTDISDGQRQRIMLARAICQEPRILVLDEPTSFLDIKHKIELLGILRHLAKDRNVAVLMSLHEIDLAAKVSDEVMCIKGERIDIYGPPDEVLHDDMIASLYDLNRGSYNSVFGSVELERPLGEPKVFVLGGCGMGTPIYRMLQKRGIAFCTGILSDNDVDCQVARALATEMLSVPAFEDPSQTLIEQALSMVEHTEYTIDSGVKSGPHNAYVTRIRECAAAHGKLRSARDSHFEVLR